MLRILLMRARGATYVRYLAASVGALAADFALFLVLASGGTAPVIASAIGYSVGILVHWLVSSRSVFSDRVADGGAARHRQKLLFVASALVGLALTSGIVGLSHMAGLPLWLAKAAAVVVSFQATYLLRNRIVFQP